MWNMHFPQLLKCDCFHFCRIPLDSTHLSFLNKETESTYYPKILSQYLRNVKTPVI